jgi:hypothetical protein
MALGSSKSADEFLDSKGSADEFLTPETTSQGPSASQFLDVEVKPQPQASFAENFKYKWQEDPHNMVHNLKIWMDSNLPEWFLENPDASGAQDAGHQLKEKYGEDFYKLTSEQRKDRILQKEQADLAQQNPNVDPENTGVGGALGGFASIVKDPVNYLPFGQVAKAKRLADFYRAVAPTAGIIAASNEAMYQAARENEMNYLTIGEAGLAGAALTPLLPYAGSKLFGYLGSKIEQSLSAKANEMLEAVEQRTTKKISEGMEKAQAMEETLKELDLTAATIKGALGKSNRGIYIPATTEAAQEIMMNQAPAGMRPWKSGSFVDDLIQPISSRIKNLSEPVWKRLMELEMNIHTKPYEYAQQAKPFFDAVKGLSKENRELVKTAWNNRDLPTLKRVLEGNPEALAALDVIRGTLDRMHGELKHHGYDTLKKLEDYLPRLVTDVDGLMGSLGKEKKVGVDKALFEAYKSKGSNLTDLEKQDVINKALRGYPRETGGIGNAKERVFDVVPEELKQFYGDPEKAFHVYIRRAVTDIEKRAFFGKHIKMNSDINTVDMEHTIGSYVMSDEGLLNSPKKLEELRKLLTARFVAGEESPHEVVQLLRNTGYIATLGHVTSAVVQLQDIAFSAVRNGLGNVMKAIIGKTNISAAEMGLKQASEELAESSSRSARALETILKINQFERIDQLGKTITLNAAFGKYTGLAKSEKGIAEIKANYGRAFGDDFALLVDDLANKRITDRTKILLWSEVAQLQPTSKSEMPLKYLEAPNGRLLYMLQTFTLKQIDFARNNIYNEMRSGNIVKGTANMAKYASFLTVAGVGTSYVKNWIMGRDLKMEDLPDQAVMNFWKNFAASEMTIRKIMQAGQDKEGGEKVLEKAKAAAGTAVNLGVPILDIVQTAGKDILNYMTPDKEGWSVDDKAKTYRSTQYIPVAGKFLYNFFGGGLEKWNTDRDKRSDKEMKWGS